MIEAYFDESGTHRGAKILCVAGYAGDRQQWNTFVEEWHGRLNEFDIPLFHATNPNCNKLRPYLAEAIFHSNLKGIVCSVNPDIFKCHYGKELKSKLGNEYAICAFGCGLEISKYEEDPVSIFLEAGQPNISYVQETFESMIGDPIYHIASVTVALKKDYLPLQTADFLAHVISVGDDYWINKLMASGNISHAEITPEQIKKILEEIKPLYSRRRHILKRIRREKNI